MSVGELPYGPMFTPILVMIGIMLILGSGVKGYSLGAEQSNPLMSVVSVVVGVIIVIVFVRGLDFNQTGEEE